MKRLVDRRRNFGERAPIHEALIDIRAAASCGVEDLRTFNAPLLQEYPDIRTQTAFAGQVLVRAETAETTVSRAIRGYLFKADKKPQVVQSRRDGFTFSRMWPYEDWPTLRKEAERLWARHLEVAKPQNIERIAVRYVNRIKLDEERIELADWFEIHPKVPPVLGDMQDFLVQFALRHPENNDYAANVAFAVAQQSAPDAVPELVLDIDVWTLSTLKAADDAVWTILDDLREYKNDIFFGSLTDKLELFLNDHPRA